jgi:hypothetical protein
MSEMIRRNARFFVFVLFCSTSTLILIGEVTGWDNNLSSVDSGSEANALREVRHFLEEGLTKHYGLGTVTYPGMYPGIGLVPSFVDDPEIDPAEVDYVRRHVLTPDGVYTHYPPGPEYLLYAAAKLLGLVPVWRLRLLPITIGWVATIFLAVSVRRRFGPAPGWLVAGALVLTPSVTTGFIGLHDQGYALALTMFEVGIAVGHRRRLVPFVILGFLQGWLTFDQIFLVTFIPLAIELVVASIEAGYRPRWNLAFRRVVLAGGGFAVAHALHFLQVWAYLGSFESAVRDLAGAAAYRSGSETTNGLMGYLSSVAWNLQLYFLGRPALDFESMIPDPADDGRWPMFRFCGMTLGPWWALVTAGLIAWSKLNPKGKADAVRRGWHSVFAIGLVTSSLWFLVMVNHGGYHERFIYRHLFFLYFVCVLFGAVTLCRERARAGIQHLTVPVRPV